MQGQHPQNHPANLPPAPGWPIHPATVSTGTEIPNGILAMRYDATELGGQSSLTEVLAYGTAVWAEPAG